MTGERYEVRGTDEGHYVYDTWDSILVGEPFPIRIQAEFVAEQMNRRGRWWGTLMDALNREVDDVLNRQLPRAHVKDASAYTWLADLTESLGTVAESLRPSSNRNMEDELVRLAAMALAWATVIESNQ